MECQGDQLNDFVALGQILVFALNRSDRRDGLTYSYVSAERKSSLLFDFLEIIIGTLIYLMGISAFAFFARAPSGFSAVKPQTTQILQI